MTIYNDLPLDLKNIINTEYSRLSDLNSSYYKWRKTHTRNKDLANFVNIGGVEFPPQVIDPDAGNQITDYSDISQVYYSPKEPSICDQGISKVIAFKSLIALVTEEPNKSILNAIDPGSTKDRVHEICHLLPKDFFAQETIYLRDRDPIITYTVTLPIDLVTIVDPAPRPWLFIAYADKPWTECKMYPNQLNTGWTNKKSKPFSSTAPIGKEYAHYFLFKDTIDRFNEITTEHPKILYHQPKMAAKLLYHYIMRNFTAQSLNITFKLYTNPLTFLNPYALVSNLLYEDIIFQELMPEYDPLTTVNLRFNKFYGFVPKEPSNPIPLSSLHNVFKNMEINYEELIK